MNNISTQGYFIKRLRDCGFIVIKLYHNYSKSDPRKWSILLNPGRESLVITCYINKDTFGDITFEFNDGGLKIPKNFSLMTDSMEIVVTFILKHGIDNKADSNDPYNKPYENTHRR